MFDPIDKKVVFKGDEIIIRKGKKCEKCIFHKHCCGLVGNTQDVFDIVMFEKENNIHCRRGYHYEFIK